MQPELQNQQPYQPPAPQQVNAAIPDGNTPQQQSIGSGQQPANQTPNAQTPKDKKKNSAISTQNTLLFSEMRENMIIMSDGSFRAVVECQSINFDLMSAREREGVEFSYQNFLNSLYFPVQILIRSRRVDIGPYLNRLAEIRRGQDNMLLNVLMDDYMDFIDTLAQEANIMDKSFYVVIPYSVVGDLSNIKDAGKGFFAKMFGGGGTTITRIDKITYQKAKDEIKNRVDSVTNGLFQMGVHCRQLNSKELGELYYNYYNPDTAIREPLSNFRQNTFSYVRKAEGESPHQQNGGVM